MPFPLFQAYPPVSLKQLDAVANLLTFTFSRQNLQFSSVKICLVIDHKFRISSCFAYFSTFPPCLAKIIISPYFQKFPPCFRKIHQLFTCFVCHFPPTLTMMHLCTTQCRYWTPLPMWI